MFLLKHYSLILKMKYSLRLHLEIMHIKHHRDSKRRIEFLVIQTHAMSYHWIQKNFSERWIIEWRMIYFENIINFYTYHVFENQKYWECCELRTTITIIEKQIILTKIRELVYWFSQSTDVKRYIRECLQCVLHDSILKSQLLHLVRVQRSFQLIKFDFIESLSIIKREITYIFHVMNYFTRFFMTFSIKDVNAENVIKSLKQVFVRYIKSAVIYCDREQHSIISKLSRF
jgi:hypothetical protein